MGQVKNAKKRGLRIYFATDLHGSEVCFRKFLAAAGVYEADVIILGGDPRIARRAEDRPDAVRQPGQ